MATFLSYARGDRERIDPLREELDDLRGPVFIDARLTGGQDWWDEILREPCLAEVGYALSVHRVFVGARVDDVHLAGAPDVLRRTQLVDFRNRDVDSVRSLARAVLVAQPDPLPSPLPRSRRCRRPTPTGSTRSSPRG